MADFSALKTTIQNYIKQNGNNEITGAILQQILLSMVTALGDNAINDLVTALGDEVSARQNSDGTLQDNIDDEATARSQADGTLQQNINSEASTREQADNTLRNSINSVIANIEHGYVYAGIATPSTTPASGKVFYLALTAGTYTNFGATVVPQGINILKYNGTAWSLDSFLGLDDAPTQGSNNLVKSGGVYNKILDAVKTNIYSTEFLSGYIPTAGNIQSDPYHKFTYLQVKKGDKLNSNGILNNILSAGYTSTIPAVGVSLFKRIPQSTVFPYIADEDGYFCIGAGNNDDLYLSKEDFTDFEAKFSSIDSQISSINSDIEQLDEDVENLNKDVVLYTDILTASVEYENKYMNNNGVWVSSYYQKVCILPVTPNTLYYIISGGNTGYSLVAWYDHLPAENEPATNFIPWTADAAEYQLSPSDAAYMLISGYWNEALNAKPKAYNTIKIQSYLVEQRDNRNARELNREKKILYVGDSISTTLYWWEDYIEEDYGLQYLRTLNGHPAAIGGTTFMPKESENSESIPWDDTVGCKSIWWRCCNQRLKNNGYNPSIISLFGGINDSASASRNYLTIGTVNDTPLVDDSSDFDVPTVDFSNGWPTALDNGWPTGITLCQVIKGCYLMLKRDFPDAEIILPTVLCSAGVYGTWIPDGETLTAAELIAIRQVQIASYYGIRCVPWYWSERNPTTCAAGIFTSDTVHPTKACARMMERWFADYLPL